MTETLFQSATATANMVRRQAISSRELMALLLARIDAVNPALNAIAELRREAALQEAASAIVQSRISSSSAFSPASFL